MTRSVLKNSISYWKYEIIFVARNCFFHSISICLFQSNIATKFNDLSRWENRPQWGGRRFNFLRIVFFWSNDNNWCEYISKKIVILIFLNWMNDNTTFFLTSGSTKWLAENAVKKIVNKCYNKAWHRSLWFVWIPRVQSFVLTIKAKTSCNKKT